MMYCIYRVDKWRCCSAEEPLSQRGGGGGTGHRLSARLLAGQSASEPGGSSTEQLGDAAETQPGSAAEERRS